MFVLCLKSCKMFTTFIDQKASVISNLIVSLMAMNNDLVKMVQQE